jgi:hypothetical protein
MYLDSNWYRLRDPKYYYFDGNAWAELRFDEDLDGGVQQYHYELVGVAKSKLFGTTGASNPVYSDIVCEIRGVRTGTKTMVMRLVREDNSDLALGNLQFDAGLFTRETSLGTSLNISRIKEGFAHVKCSLTSYILSPYVGGEYSNTFTFNNTGFGTFKNRFGVAIQRGTDFAYAIRATMNRSTGAGGNQAVYSWPSFRISRLGAYVNTDTRKIPNENLS